MKTTYVASKDLQIENKKVKAGEVLFTIESDHPVDRMLAGVGNGAAVVAAEKVEPAADAPAEAPALSPKVRASK